MHIATQSFEQRKDFPESITKTQEEKVVKSIPDVFEWYS